MFDSLSDRLGAVFDRLRGRVEAEGLPNVTVTLGAGT